MACRLTTFSPEPSLRLALEEIGIGACAPCPMAERSPSSIRNRVVGTSYRGRHARYGNAVTASACSCVAVTPIATPGEATGTIFSWCRSRCLGSQRRQWQAVKISATTAYLLVDRKGVWREVDRLANLRVALERERGLGLRSHAGLRECTAFQDRPPRSEVERCFFGSICNSRGKRSVRKCQR